jgi:hypothetical protein
MSPIDKRTVPLGPAQGATFMEINLENREARVFLRCSDGKIVERVFSGVETMKNQAAEGMIGRELTEAVMAGGRLPSRFVFESMDASRILAITAKASRTAEAETTDVRSWRSIVGSLFPGARLTDPATQDELSRVATVLGVALPAELAAFLGESDGLRSRTGAALVWSVAEIVEQNHGFRTNPAFPLLYMPFDTLLFFGATGNGDQRAYRVLGGRVLPTSRIYRWDHENDDRQWIASDLEDYLRRSVE